MMTAATMPLNNDGDTVNGVESCNALAGLWR